MTVGDRVCKRGYPWRGEGDTVGTVTKVYRGLGSPAAPGLEQFDVRWDGAAADTVGHLACAGHVLRVIILPPILLPGVH